MLAAALACLMVGGAGGWFASGRLRPAAPLAAATPVADDAIHAWRTYAEEIVHPVEVAADHEGHLVQWLSRRLGRRLLAPKLDALGFKLIGGRLLPAAGAPAAQFMYEDAQGKRYLDAYNNVPVVGHAHPAVVEALCPGNSPLFGIIFYLQDYEREMLFGDTAKIVQAMKRRDAGEAARCMEERILRLASLLERHADVPLSPLLKSEGERLEVFG